MTHRLIILGLDVLHFWSFVDLFIIDATSIGLAKNRFLVNSCFLSVRYCGIFAGPIDSVLKMKNLIVSYHSNFYGWAWTPLSLGFIIHNPLWPIVKLNIKVFFISRFLWVWDIINLVHAICSSNCKKNSTLAMHSYVYSGRFKFSLWSVSLLAN